MTAQETSHISVLREETLRCLAIQDGETAVDATFGAGGHTRAMLQSSNCRVIALDQDPSVTRFAEVLSQEFPKRLQLIIGNFSDMDHLLQNANISAVDAILMDIGVSSMQLDTPARGFSFQHDGALDMRMGQTDRNAAWFVNNASEKELADTLYLYGGERHSRRIARNIVSARATKTIERTRELADIIRASIRGPRDVIDPATRSFQAIRIWVNRELESLSQGLEAAERLLAPGGRLAVITFHSLEDAIVKRFFGERCGKKQGVSRYLPVGLEQNDNHPEFELITRKPLAPSEKEVACNPRARSAKLRVMRRLPKQEAA